MLIYIDPESYKTANTAIKERIFEYGDFNFSTGRIFYTSHSKTGKVHFKKANSKFTSHRWGIDAVIRNWMSIGITLKTISEDDIAGINNIVKEAKKITIPTLRECIDEW